MTTYTAFSGPRRIASGELVEVVTAVKRLTDEDDQASILVFDDATGRTIDLYLRGTLDDVLAKLRRPDGAPVRGPGRPKLGVVAREVTLLPRHWDWLNSQPGGASVAIRKLVEAARADTTGTSRRRQAKEATDRFMMDLAGDLPGYEEAARGLYAGDPQRFAAAIANWPDDVRDHTRKLAEGAFDQAAELANDAGAGTAG